MTETTGKTDTKKAKRLEDRDGHETYTIDSKYSWQVTAEVWPGEKFEIDAVGTWTANPATGMVTADGNRGLPTTGRPGFPYNGPNGYEGQLIGRIGLGTPFPVNSLYKGELGIDEEPGFLAFVINDNPDSGAGLNDNQGTMAVTILCLNPDEKKA